MIDDLNNVYRVENTYDGLAIFNSCVIVDMELNPIDSRALDKIYAITPCPISEGITFIEGIDYFAFNSINTYKKYTHGARASLRRNGFVLNIYLARVKQVSASGQCIFEKYNPITKLIKTLKIK